MTCNGLLQLHQFGRRFDFGQPQAVADKSGKLGLVGAVYQRLQTSSFQLFRDGCECLDEVVLAEGTCLCVRACLIEGLK